MSLIKERIEKSGRIFESKVVEPVIFGFRKFFEKEEDYYKFIMKARAKIRKL